MLRNPQPLLSLYLSWIGD